MKGGFSAPWGSEWSKSVPTAVSCGAEWECGDTQRRTPGTKEGGVRSWRLRGVCSVQAFPHSTTATPTAVVVPPSLALPVIESAFPRRLHPYWPRLQEKTRRWLLEKRLMPADKVQEYADGLCYTDL